MTQTNDKNYYDILGIDKSSAQNIIKNAFRRLSLQFHPDKNKGDGQKFQEINEAYQILSQEETKKQYDMDLKGGIHFGMLNFKNDDLINMFINSFKPIVTDMNERIQKKPTSIIKTIEITFKESYTGVTYPLEI